MRLQSGFLYLTFNERGKPVYLNMRQIAAGLGWRLQRSNPYNVYMHPMRWSSHQDQAPAHC